MKLQELRNVIDIDVDGSVARFSNMEAMYLKYLKRFITEPTYDALLEAVANQDYKGIEIAAHTLKGICGNLGLNTLFNDFNDIVKAVRSEDNALAISLCEQIQPKIAQTRDALATLD